MSKYSHIINSLLNDSKSILKSYLAFKKNRNEVKKIALSFEEIPFKGNFAVLAGVDELINFVNDFKFEEVEIQYLMSKFPRLDLEYFNYIRDANSGEFLISGLDNGSEFFAKEKILIISGKLPLILLITFAISNLISFSTLICTNAMRMRKIAGDDISMLEFGLRRAQGPMAGNIASKYSYLGSFSAVSNCLAGMYYDIPVKGTCAHAYIMSFQNQKIADEFLIDDKKENNIYQKSLEYRKELNWHTNLDELKAFCSFAKIYKEYSLLLVDTYNTIHSGIKNSILVSMALNYFFPGVNIRGVRLDSGDLAELSKKSKILFDEISEKYGNSGLKLMKISASNDINENSLKQFNKQGHDLHILGIGTNLVTCQLQPFWHVKSEVLNENFQNGLINYYVHKDEVQLLVRRINYESENNNLEIQSKIKLNENSNEFWKDSIVLLYKDKESFNEKNLDNSKKSASENFKKISHIIKLDSSDFPEEIEYKNIKL